MSFTDYPNGLPSYENGWPTDGLVGKIISSNEYVWLETFGEPPDGGFVLHLPGHRALPSLDGEGFPDQMAGLLSDPVLVHEFLREYPCVWETDPVTVEKLVNENFSDLYPDIRKRSPKT